MKNFTRKLTRTNTHSYYVLLPPELIQEFKWRPHQKLSVTKSKQGILVRRSAELKKIEKKQNSQRSQRGLKNGKKLHEI